LTPLPTSSQHDLADACLFPWTSGLPWSRSWSDEHADDGNQVHVLAAALALGDPIQLAGLPDSVVESVFRVAEILEGDHEQGTVVLAVEVGFAFDPATGRVRYADPDEVRDPELLYGHADIVLRRADGALILRDWKNGVRALRKRVENTRQLRTYAVGAALVWGADEVVVELAHVGQGRLWIDRGTLDSMDLGAHRAWLRALPGRIAEGRALPVLGRHCRDYYCPVAGSCPMAGELARKVALEVALPAPEAHVIASDEMAADVLARVDVAIAYLGALKLAAEEYVERRGLPVVGSDGTRWGLVEHAGNESVGLTKEAEEVLVEAGLSSAIEVERSTSKAAIKRAVRTQLNGKKGVTKAADAVVDKLRSRGAVKRAPGYVKVEALPEER
jgi:hypothetical protein